MENRLNFYFNGINFLLLSLFFFLLPFIFTTTTTEAFALPKLFTLAAVILIGLFVYAIKSIFEKTIRFRKSPLNFPIFLFTLAVFLSSALSVNKAESLISFTSLFFAIVLYFLILNFVRGKKEIFYLLLALFEGSVLLSLFYTLTFLKIYILPFPFTHSRLFTPMGSLLDQGIYLGLVLSLLAYYFLVLRKEREEVLGFLSKIFYKIIFAIEGLLVVAGFFLTLYSLIKLQNPPVLPLLTGFQIGFAAISQDAQRTVLSFLFGSGFGTFASDFTRFKLIGFNSDPTLWNLLFSRSSNLLLELLATTGVLGVISFVYLFVSAIKEKPRFYPVVFLLVASLLLPFSPIILTLLFAFLGIAMSLHGLKKEYYDVEIGLVTTKSGIPTIQTQEAGTTKHSRFITILISLVILGGTIFLSFYTYRYAVADVTFQNSLVFASQNNGTQAYQIESQAINIFPYNDNYHRIFSQLNLALANSMATEAKKESSPSAQVQQTVGTLIKQSVNYARNATNLSPLTAANWQNLSSVYRSLIGSGKNAEQFAIAAAQQAELLDPANPIEYITLGGLYYQLKDWDNAQQQFTTAVSLKPDFPNSYYNLAHTLEEKGNTNGALDNLEIVKNLVKNDPANLKKVNSEIELIQKGLTAAKKPAGEPSTVLPPQNPPVSLPAPTTPTPTPTPTPLKSPSPSASSSATLQ